MIDTHAHLFLCESPIEILLDNAKKAGLTHIINVAINLETAKQTLAAAKKHPMVIPTIGIYPGELQDKEAISSLPSIIKQNPEYAAIGEIGLDYHWMKAEKSIQWTMFEQQLEIARTLNMPVIIHNRESETDTASICKHFPDVKKVFHCFGSPMHFVETVFNKNTYFSFTGTLTYAKKGKTITAAKELPLDHIMIETDCPYLTPKQHKGSKNEPAFVSEIAKKLIDIRQESPEIILERLTKTSQQFFNL